MKQAAMYVRVSTSQQKEEATIESQKAILIDYAQTRGFKIPSEFIFSDDGVSGILLRRPALDKLRDHIAEGVVDNIFILSPDRLSRKYAYQVLLIEEFKKSGAQVFFKSSPPSNTPGETLLEQMQGMFAEYERAQITERTRRGKIHKARNGSLSVFGKAPYGYRYISASMVLPAYFEIVDHEAQVVKSIFNLYVKERLSTFKIRDYLFEHKIPSPKGNAKWSISSIADLLRTSTYSGTAYYGVKERKERDSMRLPDRRTRLNGRNPSGISYQDRKSADWIPISVPKIVEKETFEMAQELKKSNKILSERNTKRGTLLQGLITCKECGYGFTIQQSGSNYSYYRCNNPKREHCKNRGIRVNHLDEAIWDSLISWLKTPELIKAEISKRMAELKKEPYLERQKQLKHKLDKLEQESNRLLDAYQAGCVELKDLKTRMNFLKNEINNTRREMGKEDFGLSQKQLLELDSAVDHFSSLLHSSKNQLSLEDKRKVLRMLVKEIQIGASGIAVNHILPLDQKDTSDKNACLCPQRPALKFALPNALLSVHRGCTTPPS
jgi:site-specific DNA recombinase